MTYQSALAHPDTQVSKLNGLAHNAITIDEGVAQGVRQAAGFADQYASEFQLVSNLAANTKEFSQEWTVTLQITRDGASALSAWFQRFDRVFLSLVADITSEGDKKEVIQELKNFLKETPIETYDLGKTQGVKKAFDEIIKLAVDEAQHVIKGLETAHDLKTTVETLTKERAAVSAGIEQVRKGLDDYAVKLVHRN